MNLKNITITVLCVAFLTSCGVINTFQKDELLLKNNNLIINEKLITDEALNNLIYQKPNTRFLGVPFRLYTYNLAKNNDSLFVKWRNKKPQKRQAILSQFSNKQLDSFKQTKFKFNNWLQKTGQAPVVFDSLKVKKTIKNLQRYFHENGWFNAKATYELLEQKKQKIEVNYLVKKGKPSIINTVSTNIASPLLDSIYKIHQHKSKLKPGQQYQKNVFEQERERLTNLFRNSGVYHFAQDYIRFINDTLTDSKKIDIELEIKNRVIRNEDSIVSVPFKSYKVDAVNVITDYKNTIKKADFNNKVKYKDFTLLSFDKLKYRPQAIVDAVFLHSDSLYRDKDRVQSLRFLSLLNTFEYPKINFKENLADTTLNATIFLTPLKRVKLSFEPTISQNDIQSVGLALNTSVSIQNIFRGAEVLRISMLGSVGSSRDATSSNESFFDINELGLNAEIKIPRFLFPINLRKIIPKRYAPTTQISLGYTNQTNIGLDRQTVNGVFNYKWKSKPQLKSSLDVLSVQFVNNINPENYFNIFQTSFSRLQNVALNEYNTPSAFIITDDLGNRSLDINQSVNFLNTVVQDLSFMQLNPSAFQTVNSINERRNRLIENNLIVSSGYEFSKNNQEGYSDTSFSSFRAKIELAGNAAALVSRLFNDNNSQLFGVNYSQYARAEFNYIKHWSLGLNNTFAVRSYVGLALPYGNSKSVPFVKSFFAGGVNDNRAWTAFDLGPGSLSLNSEFNEANFKLAFSLEHRFTLSGNFKGAFFVDAGNIFNVLDDVEDENATFTSLNDFQDLAIGSGFGLRYDFSYFVLRFDVGFKTYEPSFGDKTRWFNNYNFSNAVYNIGVNYPF